MERGGRQRSVALVVEAFSGIVFRRLTMAAALWVAVAWPGTSETRLGTAAASREEPCLAQRERVEEWRSSPRSGGRSVVLVATQLEEDDGVGCDPDMFG